MGHDRYRPLPCQDCMAETVQVYNIRLKAPCNIEKPISCCIDADPGVIHPFGFVVAFK
jgi:hypothetical protein